MKVSIDSGHTWEDLDEVRVEHEVSVGEINGYLYSILTHEGLIHAVCGRALQGKVRNRRDVDANCATSSEMAQEITDRLLG